MRAEAHEFAYTQSIESDLTRLKLDNAILAYGCSSYIAAMIDRIMQGITSRVDGQELGHHTGFINSVLF